MTLVTHRGADVFSQEIDSTTKQIARESESTAADGAWRHVMVRDGILVWFETPREIRNRTTQYGSRKNTSILDEDELTRVEVLAVLWWNEGDRQWWLHEDGDLARSVEKLESFGMHVDGIVNDPAFQESVEDSSASRSHASSGQKSNGIWQSLRGDAVAVLPKGLSVYLRSLSGAADDALNPLEANAGFALASGGGYTCCRTTFDPDCLEDVIIYSNTDAPFFAVRPMSPNNCNPMPDPCDICVTCCFDPPNPCDAKACANLACVTVYPTSPCDDGNACTEGDTCVQGMCQSGGPIGCGNGDMCTIVLECDPVLGCLILPVDCDDGNPCTEDSCDPLTGCINDPIACDDGDACTNDSCDPLSGCVFDPVDCDDGSVCTDDVCQSGICMHPPAACDDGDACTTDSCAEEMCQHEPLDCDDGDSCTDDACQYGICAHTPNGNPGCDNCPGGCDDGNQCTVDSCENGECTFTQHTGACNDGNPCTGNDTCSNGACTGTPLDIDCGSAGGGCQGPPNTGEAEIPGPSPLVVCVPATPGTPAPVSLSVVHRIVTHDTPRTRDLHGVLRLSHVSGDPTVVDLRFAGDPYSLDSPIAVTETGHSGCGDHTWHSGVVAFGLIPVKAGEVTLKAQVDPDPECCEGDGVPTVEPTIQIKVIEVDLDVAGVAEQQETAPPGVKVAVNNYFQEEKEDGGGNPQPDHLDASPVSGDGLRLELDGMEPCSSTITPGDDAFLGDATITLTQTGGTGSVRVLGVRPQATAPFDDDWVEVPLGTNLRDDYYLSSGVYNTFECYIEGVAPGPVELTLTLEREGAVCVDKVLLNVVEYRVVELRYKTFIACNAVTTGSIPGVSDWFRGDDRNFSYIAASSRSDQSYYLTIGPTMPDGPVLDVARKEGFGATEGYNDEPANVAPCPAGQVCPSYCTTCLLPGAVWQCNMTAMAGQSGNVLSGEFERLNVAHGEFRLDLVGYNPCVGFAPAIDAHLVFVFRQQYDPTTGVLGPMEWRIDPSWHDEFPWHEMYLNGVQVYTFDPCIHPGGPDPGLLVDDDGQTPETDADINLPDENQEENAHLEQWHEVP